MTDEEVNIAVARKLGWTYEQNPNALTGYWERGEDFFEVLPDYCHSIAAAWEVVEKMKPDSIAIEHFERGYGDTEKWRCVFSCSSPVCDCNDDAETERYEATADTAPMAICKAFLKLL